MDKCGVLVGGAGSPGSFRPGDLPRSSEEAPGRKLALNQRFPADERGDERQTAAGTSQPQIRLSRLVPFRG